MIDIDEIEQLAKAAGGQQWQEDGYIIFEDIPGGSSEVIGRVDIASALCGEVADFMAAANPAAILALIAEVRALREDAERYRWSIAYEDNTETLLAAVMNNAPDKKAISAEIDAERSKEKS